MNYRNLFHWEHSIKHCHLFNKLEHWWCLRQEIFFFCVIKIKYSWVSYCNTNFVIRGQRYIMTISSNWLSQSRMSLLLLSQYRTSFLYKMFFSIQIRTHVHRKYKLLEIIHFTSPFHCKPVIVSQYTKVFSLTFSKQHTRISQQREEGNAV